MRGPSWKLCGWAPSPAGKQAGRQCRTIKQAAVGEDQRPADRQLKRVRGGAAHTRACMQYHCIVFLSCLESG